MSVNLKLRVTSVFLAMLALAAASNNVTRNLIAAEVATATDETALPTDEAVVSDLTVEQLAREILVLQQQMGGSIVPTPDLPHWQNPGNRTSQALITDQPTSSDWSAYPPKHHTAGGNQRQKIDELREVAFNLDSTAHRLEKLDLYEQADALRQVAGRLRLDARQLKHDSAATVVPMSPPNGSRDASSRK